MFSWVADAIIRGIRRNGDRVVRASPNGNGVWFGAGSNNKGDQEKRLAVWGSRSGVVRGGVCIDAFAGGVCTRRRFLG
jgi:hypothetical protein